MAKLRQNASIRALALEFLILTASRTVEALGARFEEFDLQHEFWTVPAPRMKGYEQHRVPLCTRAVEIVEEMAQFRLNDFVFPGMKPDRPLSDMALLTLLRELRPGITTMASEALSRTGRTKKQISQTSCLRRHWHTSRQTRSAWRMREATYCNNAGA